MSALPHDTPGDRAMPHPSAPRPTYPPTPPGLLLSTPTSTPAFFAAFFRASVPAYVPAFLLALVLAFAPAHAQESGDTTAAGARTTADEAPADAPGRHAAATPDDPRPLEIDDNFRFARVGSPRVSPDGGRIAYTVSRTSLEEGSSHTRVWIAPADPDSEEGPIPMTLEGESASSPEWSPDGRWLSFLASRGEEGASAKTQVWLLDRRGGEARQLTEVEQGVRGYAWSPDGSTLVLTIRDPEPEKDSLFQGADAPRPPWVIDRLQFKRDGAGYLTGDRHNHLWLFDVESRELTQLTEGPYDEGSPAWSPDGTRIAFVSNRTEEPDANANADIWVVEADLDEPTSEPLQVTTNPGSDHSPAWSPDGRLLAYVTSVEPDLIWYATNHLAVVNADGSDPQVITRALDRNVRSPRFSADGTTIYFQLEDSGEDHLAAIDPNGDLMDRPITGPLSVRGFDLGPDDELVALVARTGHPSEIFRSTFAGLKPLTAVNDSLLSVLELAEVRNETFRSADGTEIEGFFYLPPGYEEGEPRPTILRIHGGPVSQYRHSFNFEAQLFAARGYVVVTTNPRGSSGYGQDFSRAIWADWGSVDFEDVMAGVDHAVERGWSDPDRLGVGGWSYGGILTNYVITQTDRFEAAITGASEVFYPANYGHDHYQRQWEAELGLPWENIDLWLEISPFMQVDRVTTPTLIMGGEHDWNVPIQNSEQLYQALRRLGVPTQLVVYPGQSHGIRVPAYQKDRYQRYLAWYDRWVRGEGAATVPPAPPAP